MLASRALIRYLLYPRIPRYEMLDLIRIYLIELIYKAAICPIYYGVPDSAARLGNTLSVIRVNQRCPHSRSHETNARHHEDALDTPHS